MNSTSNSNWRPRKTKKTTNEFSYTTTKDTCTRSKTRRAPSMLILIQPTKGNF